jgi:hypothetical protein
MAEVIRCHECASYRRHVCWLVDRRRYCNKYYQKLFDSAEFDVFAHSIHRVTEDERYFEDSPRARRTSHVLEHERRLLTQG